MQALSIYLAIGSILGALFVLFIYYNAPHADEELSAEECNKLQTTWNTISAASGGDLLALFFLFAIIAVAWPLFIIYIIYDTITSSKG